MGGKIMESSMQHHNYGISISGCVDGVCFSEEFKKMEPKFSGFYKFESEVRKGFKIIKIAGDEPKYFTSVDRYGAADEGDGNPC